MVGENLASRRKALKALAGTATVLSGSIPVSARDESDVKGSSGRPRVIENDLQEGHGRFDEVMVITNTGSGMETQTVDISGDKNVREELRSRGSDSVGTMAEEDQHVTTVSTKAWSFTLKNMWEYDLVDDPKEAELVSCNPPNIYVSTNDQTSYEGLDGYAENGGEGQKEWYTYVRGEFSYLDSVTETPWISHAVTVEYDDGISSDPPVSSEVSVDSSAR